MAELKDTAFFKAMFSQRSAQAASDEFCVRFEHLKPLCESPIEEALLAGMIFYFRHDATFFFEETNFAKVEGYSWPDEPTWLPSWFKGADIIPQAKVAEYRVDFLFYIHIHGNTAWLAVECDGHDFHERTKEQAERDRSRDRWMMANGIQVMRFTGREIWRDPAACAREIDEMLEKIAEPLYARSNGANS